MRNEDQSKERRQGAQVKAKLSRMSPYNVFDSKIFLATSYSERISFEPCEESASNWVGVLSIDFPNT